MLQFENLIPFNYKRRYFSGINSARNTNVFYAKNANVEAGPSKYLGYRDIGLHIDPSRGGRLLDYGCGTGYSSRALRKRGFQVTAIDISREMIAKAREVDPYGCYTQVGATTPFSDEFFDVVTSLWVILELDSRSKMDRYFKESYRVMRKNGTFFIINSNPEIYRPGTKWLSLEPGQFNALESGAPVVVKDKSLDIEFNDYLWNEKDLRLGLEKAGFTDIRVNFPLGHPDEPFKWSTELHISNHMIVTAKK